MPGELAYNTAVADRPQLAYTGADHLLSGREAGCHSYHAEYGQCPGQAGVGGCHALGHFSRTSLRDSLATIARA
ncbi:MAG: hypothetical protein ABIR84_12755 [Candidatus Nitrotoga sp.]